jgi:hypothetical protein
LLAFVVVAMMIRAIVRVTVMIIVTMMSHRISERSPAHSAYDRTNRSPYSSAYRRAADSARHSARFVSKGSLGS